MAFFHSVLADFIAKKVGFFISQFYFLLFLSFEFPRILFSFSIFPYFVFILIFASIFIFSSIDIFQLCFIFPSTLRMGKDFLKKKFTPTSGLQPPPCGSRGTPPRGSRGTPPGVERDIHTPPPYGGTGIFLCPQQPLVVLEASPRHIHPSSCQTKPHS